MCKFAISLTTVLLAYAGVSPAKPATDILNAAGIKGGLVVHVGCGDGTLSSALHVNDGYIVHGLDADLDNVLKARKHAESLGLHGKVTFEHWTAATLPYADELVNLVVLTAAVSGPNRASEQEVVRVLAPGGAVVVPKRSSPARDGFGNARRFDNPNLNSPSSGAWTAYRKPVPDEIDSWTHFLHDAGNNAVARDSRVGPPTRIKWVADPLWLRTHETPSGVQSLVTDNGRIFYIFDEGPIGIVDERLPDRWAIHARDAFNGKLLWKKPLEKWGWREWALDKWEGKNWLEVRAGRVAVPGDNQRRLVVDGDRLYVTLSYDAPLSVLDAATGRLIKTVKGTENTKEIFVHGGIVFARTGGETPSLVAVDSRKLFVKWRKAGPAKSAFRHAAAGRRLFGVQGNQVVAWELDTGKELWRGKAPGKGIKTMVAVETAVVLLGNGTVSAMSPATGATMWSRKTGMLRGAESVDLFVIGDLVYAGLSSKDEKGKNISSEDALAFGMNLLTGKIEKRVFAPKLRSPEHHHRCYRNIATSRYIITSYEGAEFLDLKGGNQLQHNWVRGACKLGMVPANGLLYVPPDQCFCSPGAKFLGFAAMASEPADGQPAVDDSARLTKGRAYGTAAETQESTGDTGEGWPTFRHDAARKGATSTEVSANPVAGWNRKLGGHLTAPVAWQGRVYIACRDNNTLYALDLDSGAEVWSYTARGAVDSPPTIFAGKVLFGARDGRVYCLRSSDGEEVWTFLAAVNRRRILAFERLESIWPVHGSVLLTQGKAYVAAGRSGYFDGGIRLYALDPDTGAIVHQGTVKGPHWEPGVREKAFFSQGANVDVLVAEGDHIYMRQKKVTRDLKTVDVPILSSKGAQDVGLHVFSTAGLLDDSWYNRTFWMYSSRWPGFQLAYQSPKAGQLLVVDDENTYAVKAFYQRNVHSGFFFPGKEGYLLFADSNRTKTQIYGEEGAKKPIEWLPQADFHYRGKERRPLDQKAFGADKGIGYSRAEPALWQTFLPLRIRAMVKTRNKLFVAGPPDVLDKKDPYAAFEGRKGAVLMSVSAEDGKALAEQSLDSPPVFDGMIAAYGKLIVALENGTVLCLKKFNERNEDAGEG